jgi:hypothetical protein
MQPPLWKKGVSRNGPIPEVSRGAVRGVIPPWVMRRSECLCGPPVAARAEPFGGGDFAVPLLAVACAVQQLQVAVVVLGTTSSNGLDVVNLCGHWVVRW